MKSASGQAIVSFADLGRNGEEDIEVISGALAQYARTGAAISSKVVTDLIRSDRKLCADHRQKLIEAAQLGVKTQWRYNLWDEVQEYLRVWIFVEDLQSA